jgi:hypothetical protein
MTDRLTKKEMRRRLASLRADVQEEVRWARHFINAADYVAAMRNLANAERFSGRVEELTLRLEDADG